MAGKLVRLASVWQKKVLLFICMVGIFAPSHAQNMDTFTVGYVNQPIKSILTDLEHLTGYEFAYSDSNIDTTQLISLTLTQAKLQDILQQLCIKTNFSTQINGKKILFYPIEKTDPIRVKGLVVDRLDETPIQGVHVLPDCSTLGTITDDSGRFELTLTGNCTKLHLTCIGYKSVDFLVNTDTIVTLRLEGEIVTLKESVVVAFGEEHQETTTGSVSTVDPSVYSQINEESVLYAIQGASAGVLVQQNAGSPGSGLNIFIRGIGSITAGSQPLYLVDGVPMVAGNFSQLDFSGQIIDATSDLSIHDIESVTLLKDAAAASLYGSRASNGVILINTKRGSKNQNFIEFSTSYGLQQRPGKLRLLNANQYMNYINEEALASGNAVVYSPEFISSNTIDTDWQDEVFRVVPTYSVHLALRGGTDKSTYFISGNHFNQQGIVIGSDYQRYNLRMNYDYQVSKKLKIESSNHFIYAINNRIEGDQTLNGPLPNAISMPPIFPVKNDNGTFNNDGPWANPVAIAELEKNLAYTFRNSLFLKINYDLKKNVKLISLNGLDNYNLREQTFAP